MGVTKSRMSITLTTEQQQALDSLREDPPLVVDPRTNAAFVLLPAREYEAIREILEDERRQKAILAVGLFKKFAPQAVLCLVLNS